mgnify:FL=1
MTGLELIKKFEGCKLKSYLCPAGVPTIGYGHTYGVKLDRTISFQEAEVLLDHDYQEAEDDVLEVVTVPLTDNQLGALTSFVFNLGKGNFGSSTLLKKINKGDFTGAANEFDRWIFSKGVKLNGLVARRAAEKELFLTK